MPDTERVKRAEGEAGGQATPWPCAKGEDREIVIKFLNKFLDNLTIYRTVLYFLFSILFLALTLSFFGLLPFTPIDLTFSFIFFSSFTYLINQGLAKISKVQTNPESQFITAAILTLVFDPFSPKDFPKILPIFLIVFAAMASKYLLTYKSRHFFNPAALGMVFGALVLNFSASWWVGDIKLWPWLLIGGLIVLKKINRVKMVAFFIFIHLAGLSFYSLLTGVSLSEILAIIRFVVLESPIFFFALVLLVEPLTSPTILRKQYYYGAFTAILFLLVSIIFQNLNYGLEMSLLMANVLNFLISPNSKRNLVLKDIINNSPDIQSFVFEKINFAYLSGQFIECSLPHKNVDGRGIRRYFTLSSSPTENFLMITTRFANPSSSFKTSLRNLRTANNLTMNNLSGNFILPENHAQPCVFIAGGIGITPYRSMIKYLMDKNEKRPITLFYAARDARDFVFKELFDEARDKIGLKTIYKTGRLDWAVIKNEVANYLESLYYISGPISLVGDFTKMLKGNGVSANKIKHDFFPGYN